MSTSEPCRSNQSFLTSIYPVLPHIVVVLVADSDVALPSSTVPGAGVTMLSAADVSVAAAAVPVNAGSPVGVPVCDTVDV